MNLRQFVRQLRALDTMGARSMAFDWRDLDIPRTQRHKVLSLISDKMHIDRKFHGFIIYF